MEETCQISVVSKNSDVLILDSTVLILDSTVYCLGFGDQYGRPSIIQTSLVQTKLMIIAFCGVH